MAIRGSNGKSYGNSSESSRVLTNPGNGDIWDNLFLGTDYEDAYRGILEKYSSGPVSSPLGWLTGSDNKNQYEHNQAMYSELQALQQKMYDEEYQSPAADVLRQKEAGINADLNGLTGQTAPEMERPATPQQQSDNVLQQMSSVVNFAMSMYQQFQGFKSMRLDTEAKDLANLNELRKMAKSHIIDNYAHLLKKDSKGSSDWSDVMSVSNPFKGSRRGTRRWIQAFQSELSSSNYTAAREALANLTGLEHGRMKYGAIVGSQGWSPDDQALYHYVGGMMDMQLASLEKGWLASSKRSGYESDYYGALNGTTMAQYDQSIKGSESAEKMLYRYRREVYDQLYSDYKNGSILAGLLLIGENNLMALGNMAITGVARHLNNLFAR